MRFSKFLLPLLSAAMLMTLSGCGSGGSPVEGEIVFGKANPSPQEKWVVSLSSSGVTIPSAEADAQGKFAFSHVPEGTYKVQVTHYPPPIDWTQYKAKTNKQHPPVPTTVDYPETITVPSSQFKIDLSKLPATPRR